MPPDQVKQLGGPWRSFPLNPSFYFKDCIYLSMREREAETQAEGEAGPTQGARRGARSRPRVSGVTPWAQGGANR